MKSIFIFVLILTLAACVSKGPEKNENPNVSFDSLALTPPMGWNSWDCLGLDATEDQIKAVADYMAENLKQFGWEYVVIDAGWYHPKDLITAEWQRFHPTQNMDNYGRLIPDTVKYPSSSGGKGFVALADYIHGKGLKFGIHVMRGIPWNAVAENTPIMGTDFHAADIANLMDTCAWSLIMKGVNMDQPGAQDYYNSVYQMYADWGVDFVKVDDMSRPYHKKEIEGVHNAIMKTGYPMVLSLSPGETPVSEWDHVAKNAHMWRISDDFWDGWIYLKRQFNLCSKWDSIHIQGHWPDADMLPIGKLRKTGGDAWIASLLGLTIPEVTDEYSRFTDAEKYTLFTLYSIFRSPLMIGGYLPENDSVTFDIITNPEVIAVNQHSENNHELRNENGNVIWIADKPGTKAKYIAFFNLNDGPPKEISVKWEEIGLTAEENVRDLWTRKDLGKFNSEFTAKVQAHGCVFVKIGE
ncbi:MAG: glycoside hydrolase family 27 protein [Bacteroidales bacterium]|nr:glycoside hydrolase family 27 protein [Bacteroidales bacterium]MCB9012961.1 glycoside hydrolase family 27 protein [Bacteroidales bacterium]